MQAMGERRKMFSTRLPPDLLLRLRDLAERGGYRMAALVERLLLAGLDELEAREARPRRRGRTA
jgi:predicted DNA-binding protein